MHSGPLCEPSPHVSLAPPGSGCSSLRGGPRPGWRGDTYLVDLSGRRRLPEGRLVSRPEAWTQAAAERAVELVVSALDINALLDQVDLNAVLDQVDTNRVLDRIDLDRLLARMDLDAVLQRIDVDSLAEQTDLGAVIAAASSGAAGDVLDVVRSQAVGLDEFIARWIGRLRRRRYTGPFGPPGLPGPPGNCRRRRGHDCPRGRCPALWAPGRHPGEPAREVCGFRVAFCRVRRRYGGQSRRVPVGPGRHLVRGEGADR